MQRDVQAKASIQESDVINLGIVGVVNGAQLYVTTHATTTVLTEKQMYVQVPKKQWIRPPTRYPSKGRGCYASLLQNPGPVKDFGA